MGEMVPVNKRLGSRDDAALTVVLCGPVCAGKTTIANLLAPCLNATVIAARDAIAHAVGNQKLDRWSLIEVGAKLEAERPGAWLADAVDRTNETRVIVDSARTRAQLAALKARRGTAISAYLQAPREVRERRFLDKASSDKDEGDIHHIYTTRIEREVEGLARDCDFVVDTVAARPGEAAALITRYVRDRNTAYRHGPSK